eukprot:GHVT01055742.1.p1 GENE.GHVT01055742.1~~GHVT01055742.1.p1  ORF type:complete len:161 (+),score=14.38 GHVT01055742.1:57-539(+)
MHRMQKFVEHLQSSRQIRSNGRMQKNESQPEKQNGRRQSATNNKSNARRMNQSNIFDKANSFRGKRGQRRATKARCGLTADAVERDAFSRPSIADIKGKKSFFFFAVECVELRCGIAFKGTACQRKPTKVPSHFFLAKAPTDFPLFNSNWHYVIAEVSLT